jgi:hypothetical protein
MVGQTIKLYGDQKILNVGITLQDIETSKYNLLNMLLNSNYKNQLRYDDVTNATSDLIDDKNVENLLSQIEFDETNDKKI